MFRHPFLIIAICTYSVNRSNDKEFSPVKKNREPAEPFFELIDWCQSINEFSYTAYLLADEKNTPRKNTKHLLQE
jgi:hypothetical protein